jgi:prepilin-type N-terminal cleavage/methylation domain-containing protein
MPKNLKKLYKAQSGFTLIEIIVAMFGFAIIIWGLLWLFSNIFYLSKGQSGFLSDTDQARKLAFQIAVELRNAQTGSNGAYVLDTAATQQIIFYTSSAALGPGVDRVRYFVQNGQLWKGVTQYNGSTYNTSTETTYMVQNDLANRNNPIFYYYDGTYIGSSTQASLTQPVNVTQVKFVKVNLQIYNKAGVQDTGTYNVTAGAAIRNLKTNLGQ